MGHLYHGKLLNNQRGNTFLVVMTPHYRRQPGHPMRTFLYFKVIMLEKRGRFQAHFLQSIMYSRPRLIKQTANLGVSWANFWNSNWLKGQYPIIMTIVIISHNIMPIISHDEMAKVIMPIISHNND